MNEKCFVSSDWLCGKSIEVLLLWKIFEILITQIKSVFLHQFHIVQTGEKTSHFLPNKYITSLKYEERKIKYQFIAAPRLKTERSVYKNRHFQFLTQKPGPKQT